MMDDAGGRGREIVRRIEKRRLRGRDSQDGFSWDGEMNAGGE